MAHVTQIRKIKYIMFLQFANTKQRIQTSVEILEKTQREAAILLSGVARLQFFFGIVGLWKHFENLSYSLNF